MNMTGSPHTLQFPLRLGEALLAPCGILIACRENKEFD